MAAAAPAFGDQLQWAVDFLKTGGPLAIAVLSGLWAYRKDREAKCTRDEHDAAMRANYEQLVAITNSQTAALTKLQETIAVLRDLFISVRRDG